MKTTAGSMTPRATRLAAFALALTVVLGTPVDAAGNRSTPPRQAAKPAAPARANNNAARPAANNARPAAPAARPAVNNTRPAAPAARPAAARPNEANRSAAARPNAARPDSAHNGSRPEAGRNAAHETAHNGKAEPRREAAGRDNRAGARRDEHGARAGEHRAEHGERAGEHGRPGFRNAANHGENLHGGHRIPEARFRGSFGRDHAFHIGHPVMIGGQASFQFGGFWFGIVDPWPAAWLYTDAVYVDFVEGEYVLVNTLHPEVTIAVSAGDAAPATCSAEAAVPVAPVVAAPVVAVAVPYPYLHWHYWRHFWF